VRNEIGRSNRSQTTTSNNDNETMTSLPLVQCLLIVLSAFFHFSCLEMEDCYAKTMFNIQGIFKLLCILLTTFFPPVVDSILLLVSNMSHQQARQVQQPQQQQQEEIYGNDYKIHEKKLVCGKVHGIIHAGLKYSFIAAYTGFWNTFFGLYFYNIFLDISHFWFPSIDTSLSSWIRPKDEALVILEKRRVGSDNNSTNNHAGDTQADSGTSTVGTNNENKMIHNSLSTLVLIRLAWLVLDLDLVSISSLEQRYTIFMEEVILPTLVNVAIMFIIQIFSRTIEIVGVKIGLWLVKNLTGESLPSHSQKQFTAVVSSLCFAVWVSLILFIAILK
jgi:hypothetical protein